MERRRTIPDHGGASGRAVALALLSGLVVTALPAASQPLDDFGRWGRDVVSCEVRLPPLPDQPARSYGCRSLRLDQQMAGLMSVRFLPSPAERGQAPQLLFAGVLAEGSRPMRCRDGGCDPLWPIRLAVSALATSSGFALGLPQGRVGQGSCRLERRLAICDALDSDGRPWQARARW